MTRSDALDPPSPHSRTDGWGGHRPHDEERGQLRSAHGPGEGVLLLRSQLLILLLVLAGVVGAAGGG
jgi:hypothetical protein